MVSIWGEITIRDTVFCSAKLFITPHLGGALHTSFRFVCALQDHKPGSVPVPGLFPDLKPVMIISLGRAVAGRLMRRAKPDFRNGVFPIPPSRLAPDGVYHASPSPGSGPPMAGLFTFGQQLLPFGGNGYITLIVSVALSVL